MGHRFQSFALIVVLALSAVLCAQVRVDVRLVNVIATVMDDRGRYINHLSADDFFIEEDGRPQKIAHFSQDQDTPVSIGVVLDTSGSMDRKLRTAIDAVERFAEQLHKVDETRRGRYEGAAGVRRIEWWQRVSRLAGSAGTQ